MRAIHNAVRESGGLQTRPRNIGFENNIIRWILYVLLIVALVACGGDDSNPKKDNPTATSEPAPATLSPVIIDLQQDYESLRDSQQAIGEIWEKLASNQEVPCGDYPAVLSPDAISTGGDPAYQPLADLLRRAAIDIDHAVTVWRAECANPRRFPSPDVIDEGRLAARAAEDTLREAETLLADIQGGN